MATSNLYEMAGGRFHGKESVDMSNTGDQLDWVSAITVKMQQKRIIITYYFALFAFQINMLIQDTKDILKTHQTFSENNGQKTDKKCSKKPQKHNVTDRKKHQGVSF